MRHRALKARVAVALAAGEHPAARGESLLAPAAHDTVGGCVPRSQPVVAGAVEAILVAPGAGHAELKPLQE